MINVVTELPFKSVEKVLSVNSKSFNIAQFSPFSKLPLVLITFTLRLLFLKSVRSTVMGNSFAEQLTQTILTSLVLLLNAASVLSLQCIIVSPGRMNLLNCPIA